MIAKLRSPSLLVLMLLLLGCESVAAPTSGRSRLYVLSDVDGIVVPATLPTLVGDTTTILWATVTLDATGQAVSTTRLRHVYLSYPPDTTTTVLIRKYREEGDSITVGYFATCRDICLPNSVGLLTDSTLTLTWDIIPRTDPVYRYRLSATY